jgi:hypothetical protein
MTKVDLQLQNKVLEVLTSHEEGLTCQELHVVLRETYDMKKHHGTLSGALSTLHKSLEVFNLPTKRNNQKPYVHACFRHKYDEKHRIDYPPKRTNKWESMSDLLYLVMTEDNIPPDAWENALNSYRKMKNV